MWTREQFMSFSRSTEFMVSLATGMSFLAGAAAHAVLTTRRLEEKYAKIAEQEIEDSKNYYSRLYKTGENEDPTEIAKAKGYDIPAAKTGMEAVIEGLKYRTIHPDLEPVVDDGSEVSKELIEAGEKLAKVLDHAAEQQATDDEKDINIFSERVVLVSPSPEDRDRWEDGTFKPYIITHEEFLENAPEFTQVCVTYYAGDQTLADERDEPIEAIDQTVGENSLVMFGEGSGDENVVYVRNEKMLLDFEIARSDGKFAHEVLGLQHSSDFKTRRKVPKFRGDDE